YGPPLQVGNGTDLILAEDLEAAEMQAAQRRDGGAGIHREDKIRRKVPAEIHLAMRDHTGNISRIFTVGPAYMRFCQLYIADIGKALDAQQLLNNLWGDARSGVFFEADGGDFRRRLGRERLAPRAKPAEARGAGGIRQEPAAALHDGD